MKRLSQPKPPTRKMPTARAILMFSVAFFFSIFIFIFSIFFITAPLLVGGVTGAYITNKTSFLGSGVSKALGVAGGTVATFAVGGAEFLTGIGTAVVGFVGDFLSDAIDFLAWMLFYFWFTIVGISFLDTKSRKRLAVMLISFIVGLIPFINIIPSLLIGITIIIMTVRKDDKDAFLQYKRELLAYNKQRGLPSQRLRTQHLATQ